MLLLGVPGSLVGVVVVDRPGGCRECIAERLRRPALLAWTPSARVASTARSDELSVSVTADLTTSVRVSVLLWTAGQTHHDDVFNTPFMATLTARVLPWKAYADLLAQLYFVHESLALAEDIMASTPLRSTLARSTTVVVPALAADLRFLYGPRWPQQITASPATAAYCGDLRDVAVREPWGFCGHHYARHVEDLLTGPDLAPAVSVAYGLDRTGCLFLRPGDCTARRYHDECHDCAGGPAELAPNRSRVLPAVSRVQQMYLAILQDLERSWT